MFKDYSPIFFGLKGKARFTLLVTLQILYCLNGAFAQHAGHENMVTPKVLTENDYYKIETVPVPAGTELEVGGLAELPDGRLAVCTRLGELWILENPGMMNNSKPHFKLFASGLHEPLGLAYKDGAFYVAQRAELTKISDTDGDDVADLFETVTTWELSGNYCEYNHGPVMGGDGNFHINFNLGDNGMGSGAEAFFGEMGSHALWRGWMVQVTPEGVLTPFATGFRSPAGIGTNAKGELFYTENQGGWVGTGYITQVKKNDFFGHPSGLKSADKPWSTVKTRISDIPTDDPLFHDAVKKIPGMKLPSVRLPHGILGVSLSGFVEDHTNGGFGPFNGQYFIGDEGHANIMRVFMEKVNGEYQGAAFPFRQGFMSGILRLEWGNDQSIFVGMSDRGWNSTAPFRSGLQRLVWTGNVPFEIKAIKAKPDGFELEFTSPLDKETALDTASYHISGFDYKYHQAYGSEVFDKKQCKIEAIKLSDDGLTVRLVLNGLREGYIHEVKCEGLRSVNQVPLLHNFGYYSLNAIPSGERLSLQDAGVIKTSDLKNIDKKKLKEGYQGNSTARNRNEMVNTLPSSWVNGPDVTIIIGTKPGLKYDLDKFSVKPGAKVKLVFNNNDDMQHNFVLVQPNAADEVGKLALNLGLEGPAMQYVPISKSVLQHTKLLQPKTSETLYFTAPEKNGIYPFMCTYPGHYTIMRGEMTVAENSWLRTDSTFALVKNNEVVWQLNFNKKQDKPYFHPLRVNGEDLTMERPADHGHHRGLWFAWHGINKINYWEEIHGRGVSEGRSRIIKVDIKPEKDFSVKINVYLEYSPEGKKTILKENRVLSVSPPDQQGNYTIDWSLNFTAQDSSLVFDCVPTLKRGGVEYGGYAGLGYRGASSIKDPVFKDSNGWTNKNNLTGYGENANWMDMTAYLGKQENSKGGITIFDHPANPHYPSPWYIWYSAGQHVFFMPAILYNEPLNLAAHHQMALKYRIYIHSGEIADNSLNDIFEQFKR